MNQRASYVIWKLPARLRQLVHRRQRCWVPCWIHQDLQVQTTGAAFTLV